LGRKNNMLRMLSLFFLFISFYLLPWWFSFVFAIILIFSFNFFIESVVFGYLLDTIYGASGLTFLGISHFFLVFFVILFLISFWIKKMLKFY